MNLRVGHDQGESELYNVNWFRFQDNEITWTDDQPEVTTWSLTGVTFIEFGNAPVNMILAAQLDQILDTDEEEDA